jgi:hypothetical protein
MAVSNATMAVRIALSVLFCLLWAVQPAEACSCLPIRPACAVLSTDLVVFAGTVIDVQPAPPGAPASRAIRFAVQQPGRSQVGPEAVVYANPSNGNTCGITFVVGQRYVVQAGRKAGVLTTSGCTSRLASDAPDDVELLQDLAGPVRGGRVFGLVHRWDDWRLRPAGRESQEPLAGARVRVTGRVSREATTDAGGRYDIRDLPPGTYQIAIVPPPGLATPGPPLPPEQRVRPGPFQFAIRRPFECSLQYFQLRTDAQIRGTVQRADGAPERRAQVTLVPLLRPTPQASRVTADTDDMGVFTFVFVPPGRYVVEVGRRWYHPGTSVPAEATLVTVTGGSRVHLPAMKARER